jgi:hypothetical protein
MKKQFHIAMILLVLLSIGGLTAGCGNNDQFEAVAKTMAVLTQAAMAGPAVTDTPAPTETPTATLPPTATPTITITPTPDYTDFTKVSPAAATVNMAVWQGVNFKFVKYEVSETSKPMAPNSTTGKEEQYGRGKKTANLYFMTDTSEMYKKVINANTYVIVTFSDGTTQKIYDGWEKSGGMLKGYYASEKADTVGEVDFAFGIPKDGMDIVELKIAENAEKKDKAVTLYQK